jgi:prevent-host-death family protein
MKTLTVGSRELKTRLGGYLRTVRRGVRIVVTDRGEPVAELRPLVPAGGVAERLGELLLSGQATWQRQMALPKARPLIVPGIDLGGALAVEREDRL